MALIDIDIEDYVDDISTETLLSELRSRGKELSAIYEFKTDIEKINYLKSIFGLQERHSKWRLLEEIKIFLGLF